MPQPVKNGLGFCVFTSGEVGSGRWVIAFVFCVGVFVGGLFLLLWLGWGCVGCVLVGVLGCPVVGGFWFEDIGCCFHAGNRGWVGVPTLVLRGLGCCQSSSSSSSEYSRSSIGMRPDVVISQCRQRVPC